MAKIEVVNLAGTADEKCPGGCSSWLEHWRRHSLGNRSGRMDKGMCAGKSCCNKATVGGHVKRVSVEDEGKYIIPLCEECNSLTVEYEVVPETWFVSARQLPTCASG